MLSLKKFLCLVVAVIVSLGLFAQQARLIDSVNKRNERPLKLVLNDADHDGITDQLDKEPNTPAGCPVDTHGVTLDTDEDGVPDCRDKEKLTQRKCFPVDSNGVGVCPDSFRKNRNIIADPLYCQVYSFPHLQYKDNVQTLNEKQKKILDSIAVMLMNSPECTAIVQGYYDAKIKVSEQLTNRRLKIIIGYLTEKREISESRLIVNPVQGVKINTIDFIPGTT